MMKKYLMVFTALLIWACQKKEKPMMEIEKKDKVNLLIHALPLLEGIMPYNEVSGDNIECKDLQISDSVYTINFSQGKDKPSIQVNFQEQSQTALVKLLPDTSTALNGQNAIGIAIEKLPNFEVGTAFFKYGTVQAWTKPEKITTLDSLKPENNQFFIWKYNNGTYGAVMPLMGNGYVNYIGQKDGKLVISGKSMVKEHQTKEIPVAVFAFGKDPFKMVENLYHNGMVYMDKQSGLRVNKVYPPMFEKLMWCTWNSFGHGLDEKKVFEGMDAFRAKGFRIPMLLLDDGWSVVSSYGTGMLESYYPEKSKFPDGFKGMIAKLKSEYNVEDVGVWHAFTGYWKGINPNGILGQKFKNDLLPYQDKVRWVNEPEDTMYVVNPMKQAGFDFYDEWYQYLKGEGVSFVKVDNQLSMNKISANNYPFSILSAAMQKNMQDAVKKNFDGHVINCMDMTTDAVYNYGSSALGRSSEDFFPENTSYNMTAGNAAVHVLANLHNSLWWSQLVWPDFDMFQTHHPNAEYHAIARAISGGPIYITDSPGKSNLELLSKLIYKNGKIIRSDRPAMPSEDCLFHVQDNSPFKAHSMSNGVGLLAIFNTADKESVSGNFKISDVYNIAGNKWVIYDYLDQKAQICTDVKQHFPVQLSRMGYKYYLIAVIENGFAAIGNIDKYNAPKTIKNIENSNGVLKIFMQETGGVFLAYTEREVKSIVDIKGQEIPFSKEENILKVKLSESQDQFTIEWK